MIDNSNSLNQKSKIEFTIALVRVLGKDRYDFNTADHNIGLLYLADAARQNGVVPTVFDPYDGNLYATDEDPLLSKEFNIFAFTTHYLNIEETLHISKLLKSKYPRSLILYGGHQVASAAKDLLQDCKFVDVVCIGEGEGTLGSLITRIRRGESIQTLREQGIFFPDTHVDLQVSNIPTRVGSYSIARMLTSRGCPFSCTFCTTPTVRDLSNEPYYREASPEYIVNEMEELIYKHKTHRIYINDDLFALNNLKSHYRALQIANEIIRRNLKISYKVQLRSDSFKPEHKPVLQTLRESGLREVFLGVESGSDLTLMRYNKKLSFQDNLAAIQLYDSVGIKVNAGNIVASPDSSVSEICESVNTFAQMQIAYLFFRRVSFRAIAFPGTDLERQLDLEGRLESKPKYFVRNYSFSDSRVGDVVSLLETAMPTFLKEVGGEIFKLRNRAMLQNYESRLMGEEDSNLSHIFSYWNVLSAKFLLRWFHNMPGSQINENKFLQEFGEFIDKTHKIKVQLAKITNESKIEEFDSDSF